jgi:hypothetical protein
MLPSTQWGKHYVVHRTVSSFIGLFPSNRERRLADEEAAYALDKHGDQAAMILLMKAQQTRSPERRLVYKLALNAVKKMRE